MAARPVEEAVSDRRLRRRQETLAEIRGLAVTLMAEVGVAGLTMTRLARAVGIKPPSLYKYFPSVLAVHEDLFREGQQANLDVLRTAMTRAEPGLPALRAGLEAQGRWAVTHPVLAQLLFWRPVPGFVPSADAMAPARAVVELLEASLREAVSRGELRPEGAADPALELLSILHFGVLSQHLANAPGQDWDTGPFTRLHGEAIALFVARFAAGTAFPAASEGHR